MENAKTSNTHFDPTARFHQKHSLPYSVRLFGTANAQVEDKTNYVRLAWIRGAIILHAGGRGGGQIGTAAAGSYLHAALIHTTYI